MGTGVLVGPRHVLTSAHVLVSEKDPSKTVGSHLRVQPARNGDHQPFPEVKVRGWRVDPRWIRKVGAHWQVQARFDYGLVVLEKDVSGWKHPGLGECSLAYWGAPDICFPQTEVGLAADKVAGQDAWSAGYPGDREPGTMHGGAGQITYDNHKGVLMHTIDTYGGHSGAPIWIKRHGMWCLVGIHSRGGRWAVVGGRTVPTHNAAVLVSFDVLRQVEEWKRSFRGVTREGSRFEHELLERDLPGGGVIRLGRGETPPKPIRLSHFHVRKYLSSAGLLSDTSPGVMTPARMSPGYVDDARRARLQRELEALLRGSYAHALSPKVQLRMGLADLTEAKFHKPIFAGFASYGRPPAGQMEGASLVKILALYALYQLRFDLNHFAREQGITSGAALRTAIVKEWTKAGLTKAPAFTELFQFVPGDPVQVKLCGTPDIHGNWTARVLIVRLGFEYIGSVALQSGLFDEASGGLWLNAAYEEPAVKWTDTPFPNLKRHNVSAYAAATYFALLAQGRLVDQATSNEIAAVLQRTKCMDIGLIDGIQTLPGFPTGGGRPVTPPNKCGILKKKIERGRVVRGKLFHEAIHIVRQVPAGRRLQYAVAVLTEEPPELSFPDLGKDLDALIAAQNP